MATLPRFIEEARATRADEEFRAWARGVALEYVQRNRQKRARKAQRITIAAIVTVGLGMYGAMLYGAMQLISWLLNN